MGKIDSIHSLGSLIFKKQKYSWFLCDFKDKIIIGVK